MKETEAWSMGAVAVGAAGWNAKIPAEALACTTEGARFTLFSSCLLPRVEEVEQLVDEGFFLSLRVEPMLPTL